MVKTVVLPSHGKIAQNLGLLPSGLQSVGVRTKDKFLCFFDKNWLIIIGALTRMGSDGMHVCPIITCMFQVWSLPFRWSPILAGNTGTVHLQMNVEPLGSFLFLFLWGSALWSCNSRISLSGIMRYKTTNILTFLHVIYGTLQTLYLSFLGNIKPYLSLHQ